MYKKLLGRAKGEKFSNPGEEMPVSFIISLKKEIKVWKLLSFLLILSVILLFFIKYMGEENLPITARHIPSLRSNVIAEITIDSVILEDKEREKMLSGILKSDRIKGLLVVINSPGGAPNPSEIIYSYLKLIRNKIPVIAFIKDVGASGGYMVALGAHKIAAMPSSIIGSIGVRSGPRFDFSEFIKNHGIGYEVYGTSPYKTAGSVFKKIDELEREYQQETLSELMSIFKGMVSKERKLEGHSLEEVANAKVFYGEKALKLGLIDLIATKEEVIESLRAEVGIKDIKVQEINPEMQKHEHFLSRFMVFTNRILTFFKRAEMGMLNEIII